MRIKWEWNRSFFITNLHILLLITKENKIFYLSFHQFFQYTGLHFLKYQFLWHFSCRQTVTLSLMVRYSMEEAMKLEPDGITIHSLAIKRASRLSMNKQKYTGFFRESHNEVHINIIHTTFSCYQKSFLYLLYRMFPSNQIKRLLVGEHQLLWSRNN